MKALAIILLLVGLGAGGIGVMHYVQYTDLQSRALGHLDKARKFYEQGAAKQGTDEGIKLKEEGDTWSRAYNSVMDIAEWRKGYVTMDAIISGVALLLSVTLFVIAARRRRAYFASRANASAY